MRYISNKVIYAGCWRVAGCIITIAMVFCATSCRKLVEVEVPSSYTTAEDVFGNDKAATAAMTSVYNTLSASDFGRASAAHEFLACYGGLLSDELALVDATKSRDDWNVYYQNRVLPEFLTLDDFWSNLYKNIYKANAVLEGIAASTTLSAAVEKQLEGEARFVRAYTYFNLAALWGDVPLVLGTDYKINARTMRSPVDSVYQLVLSDIALAKGLLSDKFVAYDLVATTEERVRPTRYAAAALLARVQLQRGAFREAETAASEVIDQRTLFDTVSLPDAFLKNSRETIWALQNVRGDMNTSDARVMVITSTGVSWDNRPFYLSPLLVDSFETGDRRRNAWMGKYTDSAVSPLKDYYYAYKYKSIAGGTPPITEYNILFRLSEQYLIRAEARAQQGNAGDAAADLNVIRRKAGLPNTTAASADALVQAVRHERQTELFMEGHRWLDLKRTGNLDAVMSVATPLKGGTWKPYQRLLPIPQSERRKINGLTQNDGY